MLQTRIPVPRLVDWIDQVVLYLHVGPRANRKELLEKLRGYGIRTATDLDNAFDTATTDAQKKALYTIVEPKPGPGPPRLELVRASLEDEEWMANLRAWRSASTASLSPIRLRVATLKDEPASAAITTAAGG